MMQVTEDTPPDMLAGAMDLTVHLPDGKPVKMSVNRSTPMMDLLIQVTTAHRLQPSAHIIQALSCAPSFKQVETILPYKPNTPIGALDTQHIKVVPKFFNKSTSRTSTLPNGYVQPFESTFRLQVHLPRNQLYVIRVNQYVLLEDIMKKVCSEKNLDPNKYEFRHPGNLQEVLDPKLTLSDYELTEVSVVHRGRAISASDVSVLQREEERRRQQSKNGGGVFNLIFKRGKSGLGSGSVSSDTRSISPTRSDDSNSRSVTPPVIQTPHILQTIQQENTQIIQSAMDKPKAPYRKRRPAPKPPSAIENTPNENECNLENSVNSTHITIEDIEDVKNNQAINDKNIEKTLMSADNGLTICHSRNSSDSSGYHEASILSDSVNLQTLPRRNKTNLTAGTSNVQQNNLKQLPGITTNLKKMETHSKSAINLTTVQRKKKAPPPPPALKTCVSVTNLSNSSSNVDSSNISIPVEIEPTKEPLEEKRSACNLKSTNSMSINSEIIVNNSHMTTNIDPSNIEKSPVLSNIVIDKKEINNTQKLDNFSTDTSKNVIEAPIKNGKDDIAHSLPNSIESLELNTCSTLDQTNSTDDSGITADLVDTDWQYQLPSPPKAFRDSSPTNLTEITNYNTISFAGFQSESTIVNTPELIEKLEQIRDSQKTSSSGRTSEISELTDRNDEKRLSEISTETITDPPDGFSDYVNKFSLDDLEKLRSQILEKELASLKLDINNTKNKIHERNNTTEIFDDSKHNSKNSTLKITTPEKSDANYATLPNFKISTYDKPKQAINIFEDDSIRSNVENKSTHNVNKFLESDKTSNIVENYDFKKRSSGISERELNILNTITSQNVSDKSDSLKSNPQMNENIFKKPQTIQKYKSNQSHKISKYNSSDIRVEKLSTNIQRSDSLYLSKTEEVSQQLNPVKRSLSHVSLDMYKNELPEEKESVRKSSSQWNVSDLQSLQVMRSILPKLTNSETNSSTPNLTTDNSSTYIEVKEEPTVKLRRHKYSPPSINLSTWSERPKSLVSLKSDQDYRTSSYTLSENNSTYSKNTFQSNHTESQVTNKTNENTLDEVDCGKVTVNSKKVFDHCKTHVQENHPMNNKLCNQPFNINPPKSVPLQPNPVLSEQTALAKKLINHTTAMGFKRPENRFNVNRAPRPHSIAFDSSIGDISRVPIVRSVELKKSFRDNSANSSIVHLKNIDCEETPSNTSKNKYFIQKNDTVNCYSTVVSNNSNESQNSDCQTSCDNNYFNSDPSSQHTDAYSKSSNELKRSTSSINSENAKNYNYNNRYNLNDNSNGIRSIKIGGHHSTFGVSAPVVKGFKIQSNTKSMNNITNGTNFDKSIPIWKENSDIKINTDNQKVNTLSKSETNKFTKPAYTSNSSVPFSQNLLKRNSSSVKYEYTNSELNLKNENSMNTKIIINGVDHSNNLNKNFSNVIQIPTPPPLTPKITAVMKKPNKECCEDPRDQLLDAIRNFGGRENLKSIKRVC